VARLGVVVNARARCARRDPELAARLRRLVSGDCVELTVSADQIEGALARLRKRGVDALLLVGGDGTFTGTLTPLLRSWPGDALPTLIPTTGGTVNTIARSLGARAEPEEAIRRCLDGATPQSDSLRAVVEVRADGAPARFGLIFANGAGARLLDEYYRGPIRGVGAAAWTVGRIAGSALLRGALARQLFSAFQAEVSIDGKLLERQLYTVLAAANVRHVGLGFQPFHSAGADPARIHFTMTDGGPLALMRELPALQLGIATQSSVLQHFSMQRVSVRASEPQAWSFDGDTYPPARELEIAAGPVLRFLCP
jgi:diacylglycerol kinase family enzyme